MSKPSFIKRILSLGKNEEETAEAAVATESSMGSGAVEASDRPSITEILFQRSGPPPVRDH